MCYDPEQDDSNLVEPVPPESDTTYAEEAATQAVLAEQSSEPESESK